MKLPSSKIMNLSYWSLPHHNQHKWLVWVGMETRCMNVTVWMCVLKAYWKFVPTFGGVGRRGHFLKCLGKKHGVTLWLMGSEFSLPSVLPRENTVKRSTRQSRHLVFDFLHSWAAKRQYKIKQKPISICYKLVLDSPLKWCRIDYVNKVGH